MVRGREASEPVAGSITSWASEGSSWRALLSSWAHTLGNAGTLRLRFLVLGLRFLVLGILGILRLGTHGHIYLYKATALDTLSRSSSEGSK